MSTIANHTGIEKVTYGVTDLDQAKAFWTDFGLAPVENANGHAEFAAQNGASVEIRQADDPELAPPVGADVDATAREVMFGVESQADIDALEANLSADRDVRKDADGSIHTVKIGLGEDGKRNALRR